MLHMLAFLLVMLVVANSESCGKQNVTKPQLGVTVADISYAGTDVASKLYVRVLIGNNPQNAAWSDWQDLDTPGCDDLDRDQTDYFDLDVGGSCDPWLAISFYSKTTDGILIDSLSYWDGTGPQTVDVFCSMIVGPGAYNPSADSGDACFVDIVTDATDQVCKNWITNDPSFDKFWVDADRECNIVSINLNGRKWPVGAEFYLSDPGTPYYPSTNILEFPPPGGRSCPRGNQPTFELFGSSFSYVPSVENNWLVYAAMAVVAISVISFICGYYYFKRKYGDSVYKPLMDEAV